MSAVARRMVSTEKRAKIVELAKDGLDNAAIAREVGLGSRQAVAYHLKAWFEETRPDVEATEHLRQMQWTRLEDIVSQLRPRVMGPLMGMFGPVRDPETKEFIIVPQPAVIDRLMKVYDRQARLMGLDLQPGLGVAVVTREQLAALLYVEAPIDVEAKELTDGE